MLHLHQQRICFPQTLHPFLCTLQRLITEVQCTSVMRLQNEKAHRHGAIGLLQDRMLATEQLAQLDHVVVALAHLFSVDGDHIIMQPIPCGHFMVAYHALCDLALVMRKLKIHTTTMDVKSFAQIFSTHRGALDVPSRETLAPWAFPAHDVFGRRVLPQREIGFISFLFLRFQFSRGL